MEDTLHPFVNYVIIPLFAFANAGIFLLDMDPVSIFQGISLAVICGLVIGKMVGIFVFSWLAIKLKMAPMPDNSTWKMLGAISMLGGIGFTVSLFIANLSFGTGSEHDNYLLNHAKLGIVVGSLLSGILGYIALRCTLPKNAQPTEIEE
jgi:NhaA family Na+:H+ antiporter